jgi:hypothetical protein
MEVINLVDNEIIDLTLDDDDYDTKAVVEKNDGEESDGEEAVLAQGINTNGEWKGDDLRKLNSYNKPTFNAINNTYKTIISYESMNSKK